MEEKRSWLTSGRLLWSILAIGLALRTWHYLRGPVMWHDEAALVMNVLWLDFGQLLGPLVWHEAAPPLFLWLERAMALGFGESLYVLRLLPFLASCASLLFMLPICRRCLPPLAIPFALTLMACSDSLLFHACEAKPYAIDVFVTTLLLAIVCARWQVRTKSWLCIALSPLLIFVSYPSCFVFGAVILSLLSERFRQHRVTAYRDYFHIGLLTLTVLLSFTLLYLGPVRAQRDHTMESDWIGFFPDWSQPETVPAWLMISVSEAFRYCFKPWGMVFPLLALIGAMTYWRRSESNILFLLAGPVVLLVFASLIHAYPLGARRVVIFAIPCLSILIAASVPLLLEWFANYRRWTFPALVVLLGSVSINAIRRTVSPWPRSPSAQVAQYVQQHRRQTEPVLCNDWTYFYYLRSLGSQLQDLPQLVIPPKDGACWIINNGLIPRKDRLLELQSKCIFWKIERIAHFEHATVVRIVPTFPQSSSNRFNNRWRSLRSLVNGEYHKQATYEYHHVRRE